VPGLRREEIASLAGMSVDCYVRLEQGRDLTPSPLVLDALARALRLGDVEREHLHSLVRIGELSVASPEFRTWWASSVEPVTPSADAMALLGTWAATEDSETSADHARDDGHRRRSP
jgi:transcriptional regulator with XRE-family HTH domain